MKRPETRRRERNNTRARKIEIPDSFSTHVPISSESLPRGSRMFRREISQLRPNKIQVLFCLLSPLLERARYGREIGRAKKGTSSFFSLCSLSVLFGGIDGYREG